MRSALVVAVLLAGCQCSQATPEPIEPHHLVNKAPQFCLQTFIDYVRPEVVMICMETHQLCERVYHLLQNYATTAGVKALGKCFGVGHEAEPPPARTWKMGFMI